MQRYFAMAIHLNRLLLLAVLVVAGCSSPRQDASNQHDSRQENESPDQPSRKDSDQQTVPPADERVQGPPDESPPTESVDSPGKVEVTPSTSEVAEGEIAAKEIVTPEIVTSEISHEEKPTAPAKSKLKQRERLFVDWPKPALALFISGRQHGYIEPCGCTGLENQLGGLARRKSLMQDRIEAGWPLIAMDVGNQVRRFGLQPVIKYEKTMEALTAMKYAAIGFGPDDLRLPSLDLLRIIVTVFPETPTPFVSANIVIDDSIMSTYRVIESGGKKIGITSVLGEDERKKLSSTDITIKSPEEGLKQVWPQLEEADCDLYVLLAHASLGETRALATKFPDFDVIVTAGGAGEPTLVPEKIPNTRSQMVQVGTKGMYVGVIGIFDDNQKPLRYQRVPLDDRFGDSDDMLRLLKSYQEQLQTSGLDGLGVTPQPHPSGRKYVGSQACMECHDEEYDIWKNGLDDFPGYHSHATDSIVRPPNDRSEIARHFDPECISCHVTGWNPQKYYPYESGYLDLKKSSSLHGNGCENCHGPGSAHVLEESRDTIVRSNKETCLTCHDLDNSPDFDFDSYWRRIKHGSGK